MDDYRRRKSDDDGDEECIKIYPHDKGMILKMTVIFAKFSLATSSPDDS